MSRTAPAARADNWIDANAQLKIGECYNELDMHEEAVAHYARVNKSHFGEISKLAQQRLKNKGR